VRTTSTRVTSRFLYVPDRAAAERDREVATQEAMREIALVVGGQYNGYAVRSK